MSAALRFDGGQIEPAEPIWIRQDVHLDDFAPRNREADHGKQAPVRKTRHDADVGDWPWSRRRARLAS